MIQEPDLGYTFVDSIFTGDELMQLSETDLQQLEDLAGMEQGTALWWDLWRLERAEREGETDGEETDDSSA